MVIDQLTTIDVGGFLPRKQEIKSKPGGVSRAPGGAVRAWLCAILLSTGWLFLMNPAGTLRAAETGAKEKAGVGDGLRLVWEKRFLEIHGNQIPGGPIRIHYLEAYCRPGSTDRDWRETVIPHQSRLISQDDQGRRLEIEDRLEDGVVVRHLIEAGNDEVTFTVHATNPTETVSQAHWAQPCMRVDGFTGADPADARKVYPPYIRNCFLVVDGKLTRLPTRPWALEARYVPGQVYAAPNVDRNDVNPRPLSQIVPSSGLTGCFSKDGRMILAVAWNPFQEIFQGVITCMHNDFRIGGLAPGETKVIRGKLYVVPADVDALMNRVADDFPTWNEPSRSTADLF